MNTFDSLPGGYSLAFEVDMKKDKKLVLWVNIAAMAGAAVMAVPMAFIVPLRPLFDMSNGFGPYFLRFGVLIAASWLYIVLHELTHGAAYKLFSKNKLNFGFNGLFAWCGCRDCYFPRNKYIVVALAPLVVWGVLLGILCALCGAFWQEWFWVAYIVQIANVTGAAGDIYVSARLTRCPADTLASDDGLGMKIYVPEK